MKIETLSVPREDKGTTYDTNGYVYTSEKFGFEICVKGKEFNYITGPAKGCSEIAFQLIISNDDTNMGFLIADIKPNSIHDKIKFSMKNFKKWIMKFENYFSEEILCKLILMYENNENNPLMCSSPMGCKYYMFDAFFYEDINFRFNSDYTTHDITEIKKRALRGCF